MVLKVAFELGSIIETKSAISDYSSDNKQKIISNSKNMI